MVIDNNKKIHIPRSLWFSDIEQPEFPVLTDKQSSDIVVIGGGIVGVTTALLLQEEGYNTILVESRRLACGASGHTSAKITTQHQAKYTELIKKLGKSKATHYVEASQAGAELIKELIKKYNIKCDYQELPAYVYTVEKDNLAQLQKEQAYAAEIGLNYQYKKRIPSLPFAIAGGLELPGQAQFNPVKYIFGLAEAFVKAGGRIYENSRVYKFKLGQSNWVFTPEGLIDTRKIIVATHFPIYDFYSAFPARMYGERSYIVALKPNAPLPKGMFISLERPILSLRTMKYQQQTLILAGGSGHRTGAYKKHKSPYEIIFTNIINYYPKSEIVSQWSAQDYITLDKMPYVGKLAPWRRNVLVATGYAKWGIALGSGSALLLRDLVINDRHHWENVFSPNRLDMLYSFGALLNNGYQYLKHYIGDRISHKTCHMRKIPAGHGGIVNINGRAVGVFHHPDGMFFGIKPYCTHLGCMLHFNRAEMSWDCPCHASRFTYDGRVIESPANRDLEKIDLEGLI